MDYTAAKDSKLAAVLGSHGQWEVGGGGLGAILPYLIGAMVALSRDETH